MNDMFERGLRGVARSVRGALSDGPVIRPQQFRLEESVSPRSRRRARAPEGQSEQDATPEGRRPRGEIMPETPRPAASRGKLLRQELHDPASLRRAILLSEILDRPRALRPHRSR